MALVNPLVANMLLCPIDSTAATPAIRFGGAINGLDGTGIYGDFSGVSVSIAGSSALAIAASGITTAGITASSFSVSGVFSLGNNVIIMQGAGAPVDGTTGDNVAGTGSLYINRTAGTLYIQTSLITTPVWVLVGSQS